MDQIERSLGMGSTERSSVRISTFGARTRASNHRTSRSVARTWPRTSDAFPEPTGDGTASGSHLEAPPTFADTEAIEMARGPVIEQRREGVEPFACLGVSVVEEVSRTAHPSRIGVELEAIRLRARSRRARTRDPGAAEPLHGVTAQVRNVIAALLQDQDRVPAVGDATADPRGTRRS